VVLVVLVVVVVVPAALVVLERQGKGSLVVLVAQRLVAVAVVLVPLAQPVGVPTRALMVARA